MMKVHEHLESEMRSSTINLKNCTQRAKDHQSNAPDFKELSVAEKREWELEQDRLLSSVDFATCLFEEWRFTADWMDFHIDKAENELHATGQWERDERREPKLD
jgi:hypothetical protein